MSARFLSLDWPRTEVGESQPAFLVGKTSSVLKPASRAPVILPISTSAETVLPARAHPLEWTLVGVVLLNLGFLPWAYGGMVSWSQWASAILAAVSLVIAGWPRLYRRNDEQGFAYRRTVWSKLGRLPLFWLGLAVELYLLIQGLNPSFEYHQDVHQWWLSLRPHLGFLPSGMRTPFADMNVWRTMLLWTAPWLTLCALWLGITRRRTALAVLRGVVVNAFSFAVFGLLQRASGATGIYGRAHVSSTFFSAIIYKNHAAAYFGLCLLIAVSVAREAWLHANARKTANQSIVYLFFAAVIAVALLLSYSLAGVILFGGATVVATYFALGKILWQRRRSWLPALALGGLFLAGVAGVLIAVGSVDFHQRFTEKISGGGAYSVRSRMLVAKCGIKMFAEHWFYGWGGGSFRYGFTKYQRAEPLIYTFNTAVLRWENVHDDWLEMAIEIGVVGSTLVLAMVAFVCRAIWREGAWRRRSLLPCVLALLVGPFYAFFDFPFHNPAVAMTYVALIPLTLRWAISENKN